MTILTRSCYVFIISMFLCAFYFVYKGWANPDLLTLQNINKPLQIEGPPEPNLSLLLYPYDTSTPSA